jgi:voltage-gated sodium channel
LSLRDKVQVLVESPQFQYAITIVIIINAATLGAETSPALADWGGGLLGHVDTAALTAFVAELLLKFYTYRQRFFRDPWNVFDFFVVGVALVPATGAFAVLRALRVLRVLRLVSIVPSVRRVVATLLAAIPGASAIVALLVLVLYVSAVMATNLFGVATPEHFGDLGGSLWTLFQVMTGEAWPDVAAAVMEERPMAWVFFLVFILISTFIVLNLFLAVMVNAMETVRDRDREQVAPPAGAGAGEPEQDAVYAELLALRRELTAVRHLLEAEARVPDQRA